MILQKFLVRGLIVAACVMLVKQLNAASIEVLDQSSEVQVVGGYSGHTTSDDYDQAQTFTVGVTGQLTRVELEVRRRGLTRENLRVDIRRTTDSLAPIASDSLALGTVSLPPSSIPLDPVFHFPYVPIFTSIDFSQFNIQVHAGDVLALVLQSDDGYYDGYMWTGSNQYVETYPRGKAYTRHLDGGWYANLCDAAFHTYVTVPEPANFAMLLSITIAVGGMFWWRRRS